MIVSSLLLVFAVACGGTPSPTVEVSSTPSTPTALGHRTDVDVDAAAAAVEAGSLLIDVRTDAEWESGHVPGAVHVPLAEVSPTNPALAGVDKETPVYFICAVGGRSSAASDRMASAGYTVVNVKGGTQAWIASGRPVE